MNRTTAHKLGITLVGALAFIVIPAYGDNFGSGANTFTLDFVNIGNPGNPDDAGGGEGVYSSPYGGVSYAYRISTFEISQDEITNATASGMTSVTAGAWTGSQPAANMTWYETAAFVNWLNTSTGHQPAYNLNGTATALTLWSSGDAWQLDGENLYRHKDAFYFLPSEDEWYKAAYHQNDGVTANYWDYPTGSNNIPDGLDFAGDTTFDAVFNQNGFEVAPHAVNNVGLASAYGTYGQGGNATEWTETAFFIPNDVASENRAFRGGIWTNIENDLRSSIRYQFDPSASANNIGFRVASVPEPSSALLLFGSGLVFLPRRRAIPSTAPAGN